MSDSDSGSSYNMRSRSTSRSTCSSRHRSTSISSDTASESDATVVTESELEDMERWHRHSGRDPRYGYRTFRDEEYATNHPTEPQLELFIPDPYDYNLDKMKQHELTPNENLLPSQLRDLRIVIRKCESIDCFNCFGLGKLMDLIKSNVPNYSIIESAFRDAIVNYSVGPHEFYVSFVQDMDMHYLLQRWLSDAIRYSEVTGENKELWVLPEENIQVGKMVAAIHRRYGYYQRARILSVNPELKVVDVYYVDNGYQQDVDMHGLRSIPSQLATTPPFAIPCKLYGIEFIEERVADRKTRQEFNFEVGGTDAIYRVKLMDYEKATDSFLVKIGNLEGPRYLNEVVEVKYAIRDMMEVEDRETILDAEAEENLDSDKELFLKNSDVEIRPFLFYKMKGLRHFRVTQVISPSDFRVEYVVEYRPAVGGVNWKDYFNNFYSDKDRLEQYQLCTKVPIVDRCYAINYKDFRWQRCRVLERKPELNKCSILLVDLGIITNVPYEELMELDPNFAHYCAMGFRAYLVDVKPYGGAEGWSKEAVSTFKKLVKGKVMQAVAFKKQNDLLYPKTGQLNFILGLVLADVVAEVKDVERSNVSVNSKLCRMKLADSIGIGSGFVIHDEMVMKFDSVQMKNALLEDLKFRLDAKRTPSIPVKSGGCSSLSMNSQTMVKFNSKDQPDIAMKKYKHYLYPESEQDDDVMLIPKRIRNCLGLCRLTEISTPSCFYLQTVDNTLELKEITKYIGPLVETEPEIPRDDIQVGLEVAVLLEHNSENVWFRAVIRHVIPAISIAKVILVDQGNETSAKYYSLRHLPEYFKTIPGLAHRVHLDIQNLVPSGASFNSGWSTQANESFRKYLVHWDTDEYLIYFAYHSSDSEPIQLDFYNQDLQYNLKEANWTKKPSTPPVKTDSDINDKFSSYNGILLHNLMISYGCDILYETSTETDRTYRFEKAWDVLTQRGLAMLK